MHNLKIKLNMGLMSISKLILTLLIVSINIREPFFHTRELLFFLFMAISIRYMDLEKAKYALTLVVIWLISLCYNSVVPGSTIDFSDGGFQTLIISAYLILMCFCQRRYAKTIIDSYNFVSFVVALITILVWVICFYSDDIFWTLRSFFIEFKEDSGLSLMSLDYRMILGSRYLTVWYRTAPCMICSLGYYLIQRLRGVKKNTFVIIVLVIALIMSGTRANILATFLLLCLYVIYILRKKGLKLLMPFFVCVIMVVAIVFGLKFLNDPDSKSSAIKILDAKTYINIFDSDYLRTLFFGWGCGSTFFSQGREMTVNVTELTLFETIRRYGLISTCIIFGWIWFSPLTRKAYKSQTIYKLFYLFVFFSYIMIGLTNPYLLDSVGFCALLFYNVWFQYEREIESDHNV